MFALRNETAKIDWKRFITKDSIHMTERQSQISRSKMFNLQVAIMLGLPALYFDLYDEKFVFISVYIDSTAFWLCTFSLIPTVYAVSLAFEQLHTHRAFRIGCRVAPFAVIGVWRLLLLSFG
jgi:hypothetical protein